MSLVELAENNSRSWSERWAVHHHKDLLLLWFGCYPCCRSSRMSALCSPCGFHLTWSQSPGNEPCSALPPAPGACLPHAATWAPQLHNTMLLVVFLSDVLRSQGSFFLVSKKKKKTLTREGCDSFCHNSISLCLATVCRIKIWFKSVTEWTIIQAIFL